eukprot:4157683-Pyramimonas_sp.AAC.2
MIPWSPPGVSPLVWETCKEWERTSRPHHIVPERSSRSQANIHENYKEILSKWGDVKITTGTEMTDQFNA